MDSSDWKEIEPIYLDAAGLPTAVRKAHLDQVFAAPEFAEKQALRAEVESLLAADDHRGSFLELPPARLVADLLERSPETPGYRRPATIGPYRIRRVIGQGGMGTVYEAEQQTPRRTVALKVIKAGLSSEQVLRRFEREAEALGRLQHPGIAQIYDAGTSDTGFGLQPYFAMEYIAGLPLLDYAAKSDARFAKPETVENSRLTTTSGSARAKQIRLRLELMAMICDAVQHAHQRGIIHRDLKPGNILVDDSGQPKILDFGVARIVDADVHVTRQTDLGQLIGTVAYMSPEQALGNPADLDLRSDVYTLGLILYQLLAGKLPYVTNAALQDVLRSIKEDDPTPLSNIQNIYRGDIETIVGKALEKSRDRRYQSAGELAEDLRRHLADEPIVARNPSTIYRISKFTKRHKVLVAGVAAVFVVLTGGVVASTLQAVRATRAEQVALAQQGRALQAEKDARAGQEEARRERVLAEAERNSALKAQASATVERNSALQEKLRADSEAASAKAVSEFLLKDLLAQADVSRQTAGSRLDPDLKVRTALDRAAGLAHKRFENKPILEAEIRETLAASYTGLGLLNEAKTQYELEIELLTQAGAKPEPLFRTRTSRAFVLLAMGKYPEVQKMMESIVAEARRTLGPEHPETLRAMATLADADVRLGNITEAESLRKLVYEVELRTLGPENVSTLTNKHNLALLYMFQGKLPLSESMMRETVASFRRLVGPEHPDTLSVMGTLASVLDEQGKYVDAESLNLEALAIMRRVLGPEHPQTLSTMNNLAVVYKELRKYPEARTMYLETLAAKKKLMGPEHPSTTITMLNLAGIYSIESQWQEAETLLTQVREIRIRVLGPEHPSTLIAITELAGAKASLGKSEAAEELYRKALDIQNRNPGPQYQSVEIRFNLAEMYLGLGRLTEAEALFLQSLESRRKRFGPKHPSVGRAMAALGTVYRRERKYAEAEPLLTGAFEILKRPQTDLVALYYDEGKFSEAQQAARELVALKVKERPNQWERFIAEGLLGAALAGQKKFGEAEPMLLGSYKSLEAAKDIPAPSRWEVTELRARIARMYEAWGKPELAARWK